MHFEGINHSEFNIEFIGELPKRGMSGGAIIDSNGLYVALLIGPKLYQRTADGSINGKDFSVMGTSFKRIEYAHSILRESKKLGHREL